MTTSRSTSRGSSAWSISASCPRSSPASPERSGGLRAVIAFDHENLRDRVAVPLRLRGLVLRRVPAFERDLVGRKLDHDIARARFAFDGLERAAAHKKAPTEFGADRAVRRNVSLVGLVVLHVDAPDPISLRHRSAPLRPPVRPGDPPLRPRGT